MRAFDKISRKLVKAYPGMKVEGYSTDAWVTRPCLIMTMSPTVIPI